MLYECVLFLLRMINNCICACSSSNRFLLQCILLSVFCFSILFQQFYESTCSWGWLPGWLTPWGHVLFTGRRDGDVTAWYQSSCCSMGLNGPQRCSDVRRIYFCVVEIRSYDRKLPPKICLSVWTVGSSEHLVGRTSDVAEELGRSIPDEGHLEGNCGKNF